MEHSSPLICNVHTAFLSVSYLNIKDSFYAFQTSLDLNEHLIKDLHLNSVLT